MEATEQRSSPAALVMVLAGLAAPVVFVVGVLLAAKDFDGYSHVRDYMSELGTSVNPDRSIANGTFAAVGALLAVTALGLWRARPALWATAVGILLVMVDYVGSALAPCSPGCPAPGDAGFTSTDAAHDTVSFVGLTGLIVAPALLARALRGNPTHARLQRASVVTAIVLAVAVIAVMATGATDWNPGLPQRLTFAAFYAWLTATVIGIWRARRQVGTPPGQAWGAMPTMG